MQQAMNYSRAGNAVEEKKIYEQVISIDPAHAHALNNLAFYYHRHNQLDVAIQYYKRAITSKPDFIGALNNLGILYIAIKNLNEAAVCFAQAVHYKPDYADALSNLGNIFREQGKFDEAMNCFQRVAALRPDGNAHANMGLLLNDKRDYQKAAAHYQRATELMPHNTDNWCNLGNLYNAATEFEDALNCFQKALEIDPNKNLALAGMAGTLKNLGKLDESIQYQKRALESEPDKLENHSNLLLAMVYASSVSPEEIAETARNFGKTLADPLLRERPFIRDMNPERKLKIGYISSDFHNHSAHYFFEFLPQLHDRNKFDIFLYFSNAKEDHVTERIKKHADHWRSIPYLSDGQAADLIEKDELDILVDTSGHAGGKHLLVLARKPAPIQATWLGYPATVGMKAIDYRIVDVHAEPPRMTEHLNVETLYRLPHIFCCYQPHPNSPAVTDHPPFEDNGYITFGCFNNFSKVTDDALKTWSKILKQVKNSRLLLEIAGIDGKKFKEEVENRLKKADISLKQVILEPRKAENQFVLYNKIDIALDPFPCNGGTTSMDTLWMGVPLIALAGKHFVSRMGVTILTNADLKEWIADDIEGYIERAVDLANNKEKLKELRKGLREKFAASPAMDKEDFTRNMEDAFRQMWRDWVSKN